MAKKSEKDPTDLDDERDDDGQIYVDRSKIDFDPADGLYSGTAVDGTSEIPGPHEQGEDTVDGSDNGDESDGSDAGQARA